MFKDYIITEPNVEKKSQLFPPSWESSENAKSIE